MITNSSNMSRFVVKVRVTLLYLAYNAASLKFEYKSPCEYKDFLYVLFIKEVRHVRDLHTQANPPGYH